MLSTICTIEESLLEFTSHPISQHICYTTQKKCVIFHFPLSVAPCFLSCFFPFQNVTQYTKYWKSSCCLIKKGSISEISNIQSIRDMLKYLYLERSLNICHYGDDLDGREECECVCLCVCVCVFVSVYKYAYICGWNGRPCHFPAGFLFSRGCHRQDEFSAAKIIQVLLPTVIILAGIKNF